MIDIGKAPYQSQTNKWVPISPDLYQVGSCLAPPALSTQLQGKKGGDCCV